LWLQRLTMQQDAILACVSGVSLVTAVFTRRVCQAVNAWSSVIVCGVHVVLKFFSCILSWRKIVHMQYSDKECVNDSGRRGSDTVAWLMFVMF
jgi:hypothetical protein